MPGYNFAGIKATPAAAGKSFRTVEGHGATRREVSARFRVYESAEAGAYDYVRLLATRYPDAVSAARVGDGAGFARALARGGYFTAAPESYSAGLARRLATLAQGEACDTPSPSGVLERAALEGLLHAFRGAARGHLKFGPARALVATASVWAPLLDPPSVRRVRGIVLPLALLLAACGSQQDGPSLSKVAAEDESVPNLPEPAAGGPQLGAVANVTPVLERPASGARQLGYLHAGARVARAPEAVLASRVRRRLVPSAPARLRLCHRKRNHRHGAPPRWRPWH